MTQNVVSAEVGNSAIDQPGTVAIVHDYLTQRGGAERVVLAMHRAFPGCADLHLPVRARSHVSGISRRRRTAVLLESFTVLEAAASTRAASPGPCLLQDGDRREDRALQLEWLGSRDPNHGDEARLLLLPGPLALQERPITFARARTPGMRGGTRHPHWTGSTARSSSKFPSCRVRRFFGDGIAGRRPAPASTTRSRQRSRTRSRRCTGYSRSSSLRPPCATIDGPWEQPRTVARDGFFLVVSRLLPYKNLDRTFGVFAQRPDLELVVVGTGPLGKTLQQSATPNIDLLGNVSDRELRWLYGHSRALIAPAFEDYGLTPLEAASFGKPTLALKKGGYLETVSEGTSGYFFEDLDVCVRFGCDRQAE